MGEEPVLREQGQRKRTPAPELGGGPDGPHGFDRCEEPLGAMSDM
jgi:hypothetical protein